MFNIDDFVKYIKFLYSHDELAQKLIDISKLEKCFGKPRYKLHSRSTCFTHNTYSQLCVSYKEAKRGGGR